MRLWVVRFVTLAAVIVLGDVGRAEESLRALPAHVDKIDGRIRLHEKLKRIHAENAEARRLGRTRIPGMDLRNLEAETCALYVTHALTQVEEAQFEARGIAIDDGLYISPRKNHPFGFHIATVPYEALEFIAGNPRVVMLASLEIESKPLNNLAKQQINADDIHDGENTVGPFDGTGVSIAVADSGIDLDHPDFPEPLEAYDVYDGTSVSSWGTDVSNTAIMHGTHVAGSALGRGTQSADNTGNGGGDYGGGAPGADLYFYKIGNDTNGSTFQSVEIRALDRAVDQGCDIFTLSYGGFSNYLDGSNSTCQAFDGAVDDGVVVFVSAGNNAQSARHYSEEVGPGEESSVIDLTINNSFGAESYTSLVSLQINWIDDDPDDRQVDMSCDNLAVGESLSSGFSGASLRDTEVHFYTLTPDVPAGESKTFELVLDNTASAGDTPLVHIYVFGDFVSFDDADQSYTVTVPAIADEVIAVGAWAQRDEWTDENGDDWSRSWTVGARAPFSSRGPRIDGVRKPDLCAPGATTISCRDGEFANTFWAIIDNDGSDLDGSGPSEYYTANGTSMASPMAAGATALLLESNDDLTPEDVYDFLTESAANADDPNDDEGYGLIDIEASIAAAVDCNDNGIVDSVEIADGTADDCDDNGVPDDCEVIEVSIIGQPEDESICELDGAAFIITASGPASFIYQWQVDDGDGFVDLDGANARVLSIPDVGFEFDGYLYRCVATSSCGDATSESALLTVEPVPFLDEDLQEATFCTGDDGELSVEVVAGPSLTYEWFKDGLAIEEQTEATIALADIASADDGFYWVVATSICGSITSAVVHVEVDRTTEITEEPEAVEVCVGDPASFEFDYDGSGPVTVEWLKEGEVIDGESGTILEFDAVTLDDAGSFSARATNDCGTAETQSVYLTVTAAPIITSASAEVQADPFTFDFLVEVEGDVDYLWLFGDGEDSEEAEPTHTYGSSGTYTVILTVTNECGSSVESFAVEIETEVFLRGDADGNALVFPIIDALFILEYGFTNGPAPVCLDTADVDGNDVVFPIVDALHLLSWGFTNGPAPPDPGPDECGPDTNEDDVTCDEETC